MKIHENIDECGEKKEEKNVEAVDGVLWQTQADLKQLGREHRADSPEGPIREPCGLS